MGKTGDTPMNSDLADELRHIAEIIEAGNPRLALQLLKRLFKGASK